jgi:(E)-4-hydroxy-3-methylbut-2-enyl-diphosphate synthase
MRIGTNHGSLSDRIMSRYGDTPIGMVESAMEFLRIARNENYHEIILSMKSSNPQVMVQAYRLLVQKMDEEFGECYPLHLGVTEAGDGEDGRIKSAIGIGTLLEDGIGDTIRVSLTEDPEFEIPVCRDLVKRYEDRSGHAPIQAFSEAEKVHLPYDPFSYKRRNTNTINNIGGTHVPIVVADYNNSDDITPADLQAIGYKYDEATDKWNISDGAADYIFAGDKTIGFALPGTLQVICNNSISRTGDNKYHPFFTLDSYLSASVPGTLHFVAVDTDSNWSQLLQLISKAKLNEKTVLCLHSSNTHAMPSVRRFVIELLQHRCFNPVILQVHSADSSIDEQLIHLATETGALFLEGFGDGIWLQNKPVQDLKVSGRTYLPVSNNHQFLNNTAFSILQATRTRISKTEYISCPSCGRTLFDLQETTAKIRAATTHLKGIKIAIMGCIVNGPGEMADADFGYVGSGPGKITLYKGKEVVKRNVPSDIAVDELIQLLKDNEAWVEPLSTLPL